MRAGRAAHASGSSGSCERVERLMRAAGLQGAFMRKGFKTGSTRQDPRHQAAPDLVGRNFSAPAPNRLWVADLTRILTGEGVLWLASARDAFANRVVGWKTSDRADTELVLGALEFALWSRDVRAGQLIHHSDKGCQYTAIRFTQRLADAGIAPSTGSVGDSFDNALAENLWSTIKVELVYRDTWATREEADTALFRYIDGWYKPRRIQKGLGGLSPDEFEAAWYAQQHELPDTVSGHTELTQTR
ncbi:IS3 family transposase [Nonomuraea sp. NPDC059007]|uniref:IS3 family transposase n=1 Tax=Nonomuraea sp. NPDC059007 TaxID=3346692 RepID=UPI00368CC7C0